MSLVLSRLVEEIEDFQIFRVHRAKYLPELGEDKLGLPDLSLASESVSSDQTKPNKEEKIRLVFKLDGNG